jgi:CheY-like chemotaxis protein
MHQNAVILLADDRDDDITLLLRSFQKVGINIPIQVVKDGEQAIAYLSGAGKYSNRIDHPLPDLLLLDLKMPKVDGFEVLHWIRTSSQLPTLRVVVLTSSDDIRDVTRAYSLGANSFLVKPTDLHGFVELSNFMAENWFLWAQSPEAQRPHHSPDEWEPKSKKVLLRDRNSRRFYAGRSVWASEKQEAVDFQRIELAEAVANAERLHTVEIILAYEQLGCDITLPIAFPGVRRS